MLIYLDELLAEVEDIAEYAKIISDKFEYGYDANSILLDAKGMQKRVDYLCSILPEGVSYGDARRHSGFLVYYLEKGNKRSCQSDIESLLDFDLPGVASSIKKWAGDLVYVDDRLRDELRALVKTGQFDSAIRKCFVVLKTRMCETFELSKERDGEDLANDVFGSKSPYFTEMDAKQKKAMRNYCAGLFGILRNPFAHNHIEASLVELDTVISSVNYLLDFIREYQDPKVGGL